jgi:hypothetical protein
MLNQMRTIQEEAGKGPGLLGVKKKDMTSTFM